MAEYFTSSHFDQLNRWAGRKRDDKDPEQNRAYDDLKKAYIVTEAWAIAVQKRLFPAGSVRIVKRPTNQGNHFRSYTWARIYPSPTAPAELAYTVGLDAKDGFVVKIDTVGADDALKERYERIRGPYDQSPIVAMLSIGNGLAESLPELVDWSVRAIENFKLSYDDVVIGAGLNTALGDEELLKHFDKKYEFEALRLHWQAHERDVFCRLARTVHLAGLDWWHINVSDQVRFGRKHPASERAVAVLGIFYAKEHTIRWKRSSDEFARRESELLTENVVRQLEGALSIGHGLGADLLNLETDRPGLWPDQLQDESGDFDEDAPPLRRTWIEKTLVKGRPDRQQGDHALGQALWSPQRSKDGKNVYANMREVHEGDVVFHLVDNDEIRSVSIAASSADSSFVGLEGSDWARQPGYRIALRDHQRLDPPLPRDTFLEAEPFATELRELAQSGAKGLFYNSHRGLNQGAYLTEATPTLLSILNRAYRDLAGKGLPHVDVDDVDAAQELPPYTLDDALKELFIEHKKAKEILDLWHAKKNVVLQGPPGVGKTFAAHKLAFALLGVEDRSRVGFVQFHQSYSYEDFVEGYRPEGQSFELRPGKFVEFCRRAEADGNRPYVFIIDEINRGNLSKILGELMLLIESDKRSSKWAMPLASGKVPFHVPANVHLLGLMNTADRSLAVVDYALRRRFGFVELEPSLDSPRFEEHLVALGISSELRASLRSSIKALNEEIVGDTNNLGPGFAIGHSFFCSGPAPGEAESNWYARVVRTELAPLLREYWFDSPKKADDWKDRLLRLS